MTGADLDVWKAEIWRNRGTKHDSKGNGEHIRDNCATLNFAGSCDTRQIVMTHRGQIRKRRKSRSGTKQRQSAQSCDAVSQSISCYRHERMYLRQCVAGACCLLSATSALNSGYSLLVRTHTAMQTNQLQPIPRRKISCH